MKNIHISLINHAIDQQNSQAYVIGVSQVTLLSNHRYVKFVVHPSKEKNHIETYNIQMPQPMMRMKVDDSN